MASPPYVSLPSLFSHPLLIIARSVKPGKSKPKPQTWGRKKTVPIEPTTFGKGEDKAVVEDDNENDQFDAAPMDGTEENAD